MACIKTKLFKKINQELILLEIINYNLIVLKSVFIFFQFEKGPK